MAELSRGTVDSGMVLIQCAILEAFNGGTMAQPSQNDLDKKSEFRLSLVKHLTKTEEPLEKQKVSEKKICSMLRSNVRQTWMQSPIRLLKLELARIPDFDVSTRTKWLCECEKCLGKFKMNEVETDHINGEHQLKTLSHAECFTRSILDVNLDDLQVFCKPCHEIKTYSERYNMTFEQAKLEKKVIIWLKENSVSAQKQFLSDNKLECNNAKTRKNSYRSYLQTSTEIG